MTNSAFPSTFKQIAVVSTSEFEDFKATVLEDVGSPSISEINLKVIFLSCLAASITFLFNFFILNPNI